MNRKSMLAFALAGAIATTVTLLADVDFDAATGTGFSGKGDVQSAFGWNNEEAQLHIPEVTFAAELVQTEKQGCYITGVPPVPATQVGYRHHSRTATRDVNFDPRIHHQIDGIFLTGYASDEIEWSDWSDPVGDNGETVGNACPGFPGTHPAKAWIDEGTVATGLFVTWEGTTVQIWPED